MWAVGEEVSGKYLGRKSMQSPESSGHCLPPPQTTEAESQAPGLGEPWVSEPSLFPHLLLLLLLLLFLLLRAVSESAFCLGSVAARGARAQASSWADVFRALQKLSWAEFSNAPAPCWKAVFLMASGAHS